MAEFAQLVSNSLAVDGTIRNAAEQQLRLLQEQNFAIFLAKLAEEVAAEDRPANHRQSAALLCKNAVTGQSDQTKRDNAQKWLQIPKDQRNFIKYKFLQVLGSPEKVARSAAAQVTAQFGCIELPVNEWPELIPALLNNASTGNPQTKQATLETLGILCEEFEQPLLLSAQSNTILDTIVSGLAPGLPLEVSKAAITALLNSLGFIKSNFENQEHRNFIMKVICEATQFENKDIQYIATQCLVRVADNYYDFILPYIEAIYKITSNFIISVHDDIAQQAVEFWSTICERETSRLIDRADGIDVLYHNIIATVAPHLFPILGTALTKQTEDVDLNWNVATCAVVCVTLISQTIEDDFIPIISPFVISNLNSPDWHYREAATILLGSVLEYCQGDGAAALLNNALPVFLERMKSDPSLKVKDTTAWALAKAAQHHPAAIFENGKAVPIIETLVNSLKSEPNVASQACYALLNVIQLFSAQSTANLSTIFSPLLEALIHASERPDADEFNLRVTAYESINALVLNAPDEVLPIIDQLIRLLVDRIAKTFTMESVDLEERVEFQNYLCSVLQTIINRLKANIAPYASGLLEVFFKVLNYVPDQLPSEAIMAISALLSEVPQLVQNSFVVLKNNIIAALADYEDSSVFISALSLLGTISSNLEKAFFTVDNGAFCDHVIDLLLKALASDKLPDNVRPSVVNSFGEIVSAIVEHSNKYLPAIMRQLAQEAKTEVDNEDEDEVEQLQMLRESILETYTMFIQSFKDATIRNLITPYVNDMLNVVSSFWNDQENMSDPILAAIIGIIGDICVAFGEQVKNIMQQPIVSIIINKGLSSKNPQLQKVSKWAQSHIPK